jgi:hypothetical protein
MPRVFVDASGRVVVEYAIKKYKHKSASPHYDVEHSTLPDRKIGCRCQWRWDNNKKEVFVSDAFCKHQRVKELKNILNTGTRHEALDALLELERLRNNG